MVDKPVTREEKYLAYLTGDYKGEFPKPITRKEKYLYELCLKGIGGEISPEEIKAAVNEYLEKNPVKPGATTEQAQQIEQNKTDVASLKKETGSLKEDIGEIPKKQGYLSSYITDSTIKIDNEEFEVKPAINRTLLLTEFIDTKKFKKRHINKTVDLVVLNTVANGEETIFDVGEPIGLLFYVAINGMVQQHNIDYYFIKINL